MPSNPPFVLLASQTVETGNHKILIHLSSLPLLNICISIYLFYKFQAFTVCNTTSSPTSNYTVYFLLTKAYKMAPQTERLFCWTVCAYRKPGMSEEDYHKYMSEVHAPLVRDLMAQYGIVSWEMVNNPLSLPSPSLPLSFFELGNI
jgi:predicted membrane-bound dolichyl-phosphate-mannose-protein mannosyltransferase